jgi:hypothetical protein
MKSTSSGNHHLWWLLGLITFLTLLGMGLLIVPPVALL